MWNKVNLSEYLFLPPRSAPTHPYHYSILLCTTLQRTTVYFKIVQVHDKPKQVHITQLHEMAANRE